MNERTDKAHPEPTPEEAREIRINKAVHNAHTWINKKLNSREKEPSLGNIELIQPENSSSFPEKPIKGEIRDENRIMLNRLYALTDARWDDRIISFVTQGDNIVRNFHIPIGDDSFFQEEAIGRMIGDTFMANSSSAYFIHHGQKINSHE